MLVAAGSEGTATYDLGDGTVRFSFCCSYSENGNCARVENKGTRVKCGLWANNAQYYLETPDGNEGTYPTDGHPLSVYYRITDRQRPK